MDDFGKKRSHFRFRFASKAISLEEQTEVSESDITTETVLKLSGFPTDGFVSTGWKVQPLHIPPVVREWSHIFLRCLLVFFYYRSIGEMLMTSINQRVTILLISQY